jgi:hypothetical protein
MVVLCKLLLTAVLPSGSRYRTTARIWDQKTREVIKVLDIGPQAKVIIAASPRPPLLLIIIGCIIIECMFVIERCSSSNDICAQLAQPSLPRCIDSAR